jgi:RTX calcium-binding nonapeptide repeat (4 copies)
MTRSGPLARCALAALPALIALAIAPAQASAATVQAELRVLTPNRVLDPGTTYVVGAESVRTDPRADCNFGGVGGTGATFEFPEPNGLGLLAAAAEADAGLRPLSISDEFGFGLAICAIGGVDDRPGTFWYLKRNHEELTVGADQEPMSDGDELLVYLASDNFPEPNPDELELRAPARTAPGEPFTVSVIEHGCVTDQVTFETSCESVPAVGAAVGGATTGADGTAELTADAAGKLSLVATRGADIPSKSLKVCVSADPGECPARRGERVFGTSERDKIKGTAGSDEIRSRGGNDRIDLRKGGADRVRCGAGEDRVLVQRSDRDDRISRNCEVTSRR